MSNVRLEGSHSDMQPEGCARVKPYISPIAAALAAIALAGCVCLIVYQEVTGARLLDAQWIYIGVGIAGAAFATALFEIALTHCTQKQPEIDVISTRDISLPTPPPAPRKQDLQKPISDESLDESDLDESEEEAPQAPALIYTKDEIERLRFHDINFFLSMPITAQCYQILDIPAWDGRCLYALKTANDPKDCIYFKDQHTRREYIREHLPNDKDALMEEVGLEIKDPSEYWIEDFGFVQRIFFTEKEGDTLLTYKFLSFGEQYDDIIAEKVDCREGRYLGSYGRRLAEARSSEAQSYKEPDLLKNTSYLAINECITWNVPDRVYRRAQMSFHPGFVSSSFDPSDKSVFILLVKLPSEETTFLYFKSLANRNQYVTNHNFQDSSHRCKDWRSSHETHAKTASTIHAEMCINRKMHTSLVITSVSLNQEEGCIITCEQGGSRIDYVSPGEIQKSIDARKFTPQSTSILQIADTELNAYIKSMPCTNKKKY